MNEQQHEQENGANPERKRRDGPKIYVASLSDYNAGRLHGAWLDAAMDPEELHAGVQEILSRSPEPIAEEWAIHDYEGFGELRLSEYESLERVSAVARGIAEHGIAFAAWAAHRGIDDEELHSTFEEAYLGRHDSLADYADQLVEDLGYEEDLNALPSHLRLYVHFDTEMFVRDLVLGGDVFTADDREGGVHVFNANI